MLRGREGSNMNGFTFLMNPCAQEENHALHLAAYEAVSHAHRFHSGMVIKNVIIDSGNFTIVYFADIGAI